jgi:CHRD domain
MRFRCALAALLLAAPVLTLPVWAAPLAFQAELDPAPFDATNRADVIDSIGTVTATLDGATLTVKGSFSNLASPATGGSLRIGLAKGVPGDAIGTLTVAHAKSGDFSGAVKLKAAEITALKKQALYIRIDSEKAPEGNLQGWLEAK